ncbi:MAG TPA: hypothetical protein VIX11_03135 [Candidatus Acidoferrum sp.]
MQLTHCTISVVIAPAPDRTSCLTAIFVLQCGQEIDWTLVDGIGTVDGTTEIQTVRIRRPAPGKKLWGRVPTLAKTLSLTEVPMPEVVEALVCKTTESEKGFTNRLLYH